MGFEAAHGVEWKFSKYVKEAEFGPGLSIHTVFVVGKLAAKYKDLPGWQAIENLFCN